MSETQIPRTPLSCSRLGMFFQYNWHWKTNTIYNPICAQPYCWKGRKGIVEAKHRSTTQTSPLTPDSQEPPFSTWPSLRLNFLTEEDLNAGLPTLGTLHLLGSKEGAVSRMGWGSPHESHWGVWQLRSYMPHLYRLSRNNGLRWRTHSWALFPQEQSTHTGPPYQGQEPTLRVNALLTPESCWCCSTHRGKWDKSLSLPSLRRPSSSPRSS